jgi:mRNA interferase RelE/StbE
MLRRFTYNYAKLDTSSRKAIKKAMNLLEQNPRYPSLRTKKMQGMDYIYEASANMDIRITFHYEQPEPDTIVLRNCGHHDQTLKNP